MMTLTAPLLQRKLLIDLVLAEPDGRPKAFKLVKAVIYTACGNTSTPHHITLPVVQPLLLGSLNLRLQGMLNFLLITNPVWGK